MKPAKKLTKKQIRAQLHREWGKSYEDFVSRQGGEFCALCGKPPKLGGRRLAIDSDHSTERPRGLLCGMCNRRLKFYLTSDWLRKAADYLDDPPLRGVK